MRILITGVGGFAGGHLADYLRAHATPEMELWGVERGGTRRLRQIPGVTVLAANLLDPSATRAVIQRVRPDCVYHLAGQAVVSESWTRPWETYEINLRAQLNVFEALLGEKLAPRVLVPSSMEAYGRVGPEDLPIRETHPLRPDSPYGVSKAAQDLMGLQYFLSRGLPVIRTRPFNHIGPRQARKFVAPAFAAQIAAIEAGAQPPVLKVGNLSARRDFTDVRDVVCAYALLMAQGVPGDVYNIGSGRSHSIQEVLDGLLALSAAPITVEVDPARLRPADIPDVVCEAAKLQAHTGWAPQIPLTQSLRDLLDHERQALQAVPNERN